MTLDEAIKHAEEVMVENLEKTKDRNASDPIAINCFECADEHRQLAKWLRKYQKIEQIANDKTINGDLLRMSEIRRVIEDGNDD